MEGNNVEGIAYFLYIDFVIVNFKAIRYTNSLGAFQFLYIYSFNFQLLEFKLLQI